jgi:hypothetical protein
MAAGQKITDSLRTRVIAAQASGARQCDIAEEFGISQPAVSKILHAAGHGHIRTKPASAPVLVALPNAIASLPADNMQLPTFRCTRLACVLTVGACALKHSAANIPRSPGHGAEHGLCRTCPVGSANLAAVNAAGKAPTSQQVRDRNDWRKPVNGKRQGLRKRTQRSHKTSSE